MLEIILSAILLPVAIVAVGFTGLLLVAGVAAAKELKRQKK